MGTRRTHGRYAGRFPTLGVVELMSKRDQVWFAIACASVVIMLTIGVTPIVQVSGMGAGLGYGALMAIVPGVGLLLLWRHLTRKRHPYSMGEGAQPDHPGTRR